MYKTKYNSIAKSIAKHALNNVYFVTINNVTTDNRT